jgi:hypothetical protein
VSVRLVAVGSALSARAYAAGDPVVLDVRDTFCEWNAGRRRLLDGRADRAFGSWPKQWCPEMF